MNYYNDFQNVVRSDDLTELIDKYHLRAGRDCTDDETKRAMDDVRNVIDALKLCRPSAHEAVINLAKVLASCSPTQFRLFIHIIGGGALIEYAIREGISEQAAHQMWWRLVNKNPSIKDVHRRRTRNDS